MGKGNICERCQKEQATTNYDIKGWRKWTVCGGCCKELQTCSKCQKNPATNLITEGKEKKQVCADCASDNGKPNNSDAKAKEFEAKWNEWANSCNMQNSTDKLDSVAKIQQAKNGLETYLKTPEIINKSSSVYFNFQFFSTKPIKTNQDSNEVLNELKGLGIIKDEKSFMTLPNGAIMLEFQQENKDKIQIVKDFIKILDWKTQKLNKPIDLPKPNPGKDDPNIPDKKEPSKDRKPNPNELCEKCGTSCIVHQTKTHYTIKRKRYIKHKTDFTREETCWFGTNCNCAREFREANQQTCPQCKKREFPHMKRGWMLDYEIKKAFCSPLCHVTYRELKWEEAQRLTQIEMFPPELDVSANPGQNTDWEKEGLRNEVLFLRETVRELEARLNNQSNLTPEERQQSDYLRNLQQNTLRNAENNYQSRYGTLNEDGTDKGKGMSGGMIFLIIIGVVAVIGGIVFLLTRNKNPRKERSWR